MLIKYIQGVCGYCLIYNYLFFKFFQEHSVSNIIERVKLSG